MKKIRLMSMCLVVVLTACMFIGCGAENSSSTTTKAAEATTAELETYETKEMTSNESVVSTDIFQVVKPDGWLGIRQYDTTQYPVNGIYPVDETKLAITKGGTAESDVYTKPTVYVYYEDSAVDIEDLVQWYNDYTMLDDITINGVQCKACHAIMDSYTDADEFYVYGVVIYPIAENKTIEFTVTVVNPDGEGIDMDDPDVVAIMNGVTLK